MADSRTPELQEAPKAKRSRPSGLQKEDVSDSGGAKAGCEEATGQRRSERLAKMSAQTHSQHNARPARDELPPKRVQKPSPRPQVPQMDVAGINFDERPTLDQLIRPR